MKKLIFSFALILVAYMGYSQTIYSSGSGKNLSYYAYAFAPDTVSTSSTADTLTFLVPERFYVDGVVGFGVVADSLSGGTTATGYLQVSYNPDGTQWHDLDTTTINGVQTTDSYTNANAFGARYRFYVLAGSSTQSTRVQPYFVFKRKQ